MYWTLLQFVIESLHHLDTCMLCRRRCFTYLKTDWAGVNLTWHLSNVHLAKQWFLLPSCPWFLFFSRHNTLRPCGSTSAVLMTWKKLMAWINLKSVKWPWNCTVHTVHTSGLSLPVSQPRSAPAPSSIPGPAGGAAQNVGTSWGQLGRNGRNGGAICCWFCWFDAALRLEWKNEAVSNNQSL